MANVNSAMFSKKVQQPSAAPKPRADIDLKTGYQIVSKTDVQPVSGAGAVRAAPSREAGKEISTDDCLGRGELVDQKSTLHPLLSSLGFTANEVEALLRQELIDERNHGRHEGSLADWKHFYTVKASTALSTSESVTSLCSIVGGTATNTRTGAAVALRKLRLKLRFDRSVPALNSVDHAPPTILVVMWRDKIPLTPGSAFNIYDTDANPPASGTAVFSRLGAATVSGASMPVRNPITEDAQHVYFFKRITLGFKEGYNYISGVGPLVGTPAPHVHFEDIDVDLHDLQQKYATYATGNTDINQLWLTLVADTAYTSQGFVDKYSFVADVEFRDLAA